MNSPMEWYLTYNGTAAMSSDGVLDELTAKCCGCHPAKKNQTTQVAGESAWSQVPSEEKREKRSEREKAGAL